ncbi:MAG TPA: hypothetical protein VM537_18735 [Anaerolineae bacterium]|nr:hypothetical protein [Anaerolineae bacterium]
MRAKQSSILARSKDAENRVQRYLWPGTSRCWKELWDVGSQDSEGRWLYVGEVKSKKLRTMTEALPILHRALCQLMKVAPLGAFCFAVLVSPGTRIENALVMWSERWLCHSPAERWVHIPVVTPLGAFYRLIYGDPAAEEPPDAES